MSVSALGPSSGFSPSTAAPASRAGEAGLRAGEAQGDVQGKAQGLSEADLRIVEDLGLGVEELEDPRDPAAVRVIGHGAQLGCTRQSRATKGEGAVAARREDVEATLEFGRDILTIAQQKYLYSCYVNCSCNSCNLAAKPGYSNHQSGHALDLNARDPAVGAWLRAHAHEYGFRNTIASEPWHWEYWP